MIELPEITDQSSNAEMRAAWPVYRAALLELQKKAFPQEFLPKLPPPPPSWSSAQPKDQGKWIDWSDNAYLDRSKMLVLKSKVTPNQLREIEEDLKLGSIADAGELVE